jgi:hypothetical protein
MSQGTDSSSWTTNAIVTWGVAAVIGVLTSLIANILYPKLISVLEGRKLVSRTKRQKEAAWLNELINNLHSGKNDKTEYFVRSYITFGVLFVVGMVSVLDSIVILAGVPLTDAGGFNEKSVRSVLFIVLLSVLGLLSFTLANRLQKRVRFVTSSLADFDIYTAAYKAKWATGTLP